MSAPSTTHQSTDGGLWAASAHAVATLLREIAVREVLPRWQSVDVEHKADGSLLSAADTAVASKRFAGETFLVRSSIRPARKAGRPQISSKAPNFQSVCLAKAATPTQHAKPVNIPVPPMRGTGVAWNFWGPERSASADRCSRPIRCRTTRIGRRRWDRLADETVGSVAELYLGNILYAIELAAMSLTEQGKTDAAEFYRAIGRKLADAHGRAKTDRGPEIR